MIVSDIKYFCNIFCRRFSSLNILPYQIKVLDSYDSVSIALIKQNEYTDVEAAISINKDTIRILKINTYESIDTVYTYISPLELYTYLLMLMLLCCIASNVFINPVEALSVTLERRINTWKELVFHICSFLPKENEKVTILENRQNALKFLKTTFQTENNVFLTEGLYWSKTPYNDVLELIRAVLYALCAVFNINNYIVNPLTK